MSTTSAPATTTEDHKIRDRRVEEARNWASKRAELVAPDLVLFGMAPKTAWQELAKKRRTKWTEWIYFRTAMIDMKRLAGHLNPNASLMKWGPVKSGFLAISVLADDSAQRAYRAGDERNGHQLAAAAKGAQWVCYAMVSSEGRYAYIASQARVWTDIMESVERWD